MCIYLIVAYKYMEDYYTHPQSVITYIPGDLYSIGCFVHFHCPSVFLFVRVEVFKRLYNYEGT